MASQALAVVRAAQRLRPRKTHPSTPEQPRASIGSATRHPGAEEGLAGRSGLTKDEYLRAALRGCARAAGVGSLMTERLLRCGIFEARAGDADPVDEELAARARVVSCIRAGLGLVLGGTRWRGLVLRCDTQHETSRYLLSVWLYGLMASVGRKSKGDRHLIASRVPRVIADQAFAEAGERGMTMTDFVAAVLGERYERPDLAPMAKPAQEERLALTG